MSERDEKIDAWMPVYVRDLLAATEGLSCEEFGAYARLLLHLWQEHGYLPDDDLTLSRLVGEIRVPWVEVRARIGHHFDVADGRISQGRLLREREAALRLRNARSRGGKKGAGARWGPDAAKDDSAIPEPLAKRWPSPSPSPSPDQTVGRRADSSSSSPAPARRATGAAQGLEALLIFPTVRGKRSGAAEWRFTETEASVLREGYPALDALAEARKAWAWIQANPGRRKTANGMMPFLVGWLGRSQNRGGGARTGPPAAPQQCFFHRQVPDKPAADVDSSCPTCRTLGPRPKRKGHGEATPVSAIMHEGWPPKPKEARDEGSDARK